MLTRFVRSTAVRSANIRTASCSPARPVRSQSFLRFFSAETDDEEEETITEPVKEQPITRQRDFEDLPISFSDISRAEIAIRGGVKRTVCEKSHFISELVGANVYFKPEFRQFTGSFKERGARNAILKLMREKGSSLRGVIAASAGNHALALAYHGKELGVPVTVVMPTVAPLAKVDKCRVSTLQEIMNIMQRNRSYLFSFRDLALESVSKVLISAKPRNTPKAWSLNKVSTTLMDMMILRFWLALVPLAWKLSMMSLK